MNGLEGVVAAETRLSMVDGERGELIIAGYPVEELAPHASFEEVVELLWETDVGRASARPPLDGLKPVLHLAANKGADPMDALRMAVATLTAEDDERAART